MSLHFVHVCNSAGSKYHDELSRQLADWLLKRAFRMHGSVMLLTDLYCMFNRARGTGKWFSKKKIAMAKNNFAKKNRRNDFARGFVSSLSDVWTIAIACSNEKSVFLWEYFVTISFETFSLILVSLSSCLAKKMILLWARKSKQKYVSSMSIIPIDVCLQIKTRGPLSAYSLSQVMSVPLILAREQLEEAERQLLLCRDETLEGIVFYPNFFPYLWIFRRQWIRKNWLNLANIWWFPIKVFWMRTKKSLAVRQTKRTTI